MSGLLKIVLSLSLSGTLLFFILLALKPLYKNKLSRVWQYYIWLVVIARMLVPFTPETTLVGSAFAYFDNITMETVQAAPHLNGAQSSIIADSDEIAPSAEPQEQKPAITATTPPPAQNIFSKIYENLWVLWVAIAFALLIRKITIYQSFVRFVKAGRAEVADTEILNLLADAGEAIGVKKPVELFTNPLVSSPMLLGFFRPYIILPSIELDSTELAYIMRHELTHYKRLDMFYKWLVQITVCLHWFNPFAYLLAKEVNKCCELSCDEAIIRKMASDEKKLYGDTLLNSLKTMGNYNDKLATITLTEGAEQLIERLDAIMKFKKKTIAVVAITLALTSMLCIGAGAVGAYATPTATHKGNAIDTALTSSKVVQEGGVYYIFCDGADESNKPNSSVTEGSVQFVLVRKSSYASIGPFNGTEQLVNEVTAQCDYMLQKQSITQSEATLIIAVAKETTAITKQAGTVVFNLSNSGQNSIHHSSSFEAKANQTLVLDIQSSITGGTVDLFLFSPAGKEQRITIGGSDKTENVTLTAGRWAYNCTGFFESGAVTIKGQLSAKENAAISDQKSSSENTKITQSNTTPNGNWNFFSFAYLDGYMIGIGSRAQDNLQNYPQTIQIAVNDKEYTVAFYEQAKLYAKDDKFIKALQLAIADVVSQGWQADQAKGSFLIVNQVIADKTADELYSYFCEQGDPIALQQLTPHVKKETIEKYIAKAYEDNNEMLMMLILTELPNDFVFNADALARRAITDGRQMMYLHLSKFVSPAVRKELDKKMFGIGADNKYEEYKKFGLLYNTDKERFYYDGKLVRYFEDIYSGDYTPNKRMTIAAYKDGEIDVHTLSDENGVITSVEVYDQAGFDANTKKLADPMTQFTDNAKELAISFDIDNGGVVILPSPTNEIKASYDKEYYDVDIANKNGKHNISISGKVAMMGKTNDVQLYVPTVKCTMDVNVLNGNFTYALPENCADKISITAQNAGIDFSSKNKYNNSAISLKATNKDFVTYQPPVYPNYFTKTDSGFEYNNGTGENKISISLIGYTSVNFND